MSLKKVMQVVIVIVFFALTTAFAKEGTQAKHHKKQKTVKSYDKKKTAKHAKRHTKKKMVKKNKAKKTAKKPEPVQTPEKTVPIKSEQDEPQAPPSADTIQMDEDPALNE